MIGFLKTALFNSGLATKLITKLFQAFSRHTDYKELKELNLAQWENYAIRASTTSWKDEFWTLIIGFPYILRMVGVLWEAFFGSSTLSTAAAVMMSDIDQMLGGQYFVITMTCISASFGIRIRDKFAATKIVNGGSPRPSQKEHKHKK